jgi:hypothetical protein
MNRPYIETSVSSEPPVHTHTHTHICNKKRLRVYTRDVEVYFSVPPCGNTNRTNRLIFILEVSRIMPAGLFQSRIKCRIVLNELDDRGFECRQGLRIFLFTTSFRLTLGSTQPPIQWLAGALSLGVNGRGVKLTTRLLLVPRSKN